mmetsp:Transcript_16269/g.23858  ORF Transcript_16269/g.23858 Transcript_16269/m.23858 type:complete len:214 (+) Transcript_16269:142-783(+)
MLQSRISTSAIKRLSLHCQSQYLQQFPIFTTTSNRIFENAKRNASTTGTFNYIQEEIKDANDRYNGILTIRETNDRGWGLHVTRSKPFSIGEKIMSSVALSTSHVRDSHSVQVGWDKHVLMDLPARFINHSCDANVGIRDNESGAYDFFAIREIEFGEELLWDYEASEYEVSAFETCLCGSSKCRKVLGGFKMSGETIRDLYGEYYANYLKDR